MTSTVNVNVNGTGFLAIFKEDSNHSKRPGAQLEANGVTQTPPSDNSQAALLCYTRSSDTNVKVKVNVNVLESGGPVVSNPRPSEKGSPWVVLQ